MNEIKIKYLWEKYKILKVYLGSLGDFKAKMSTPQQRAAFFNFVQTNYCNSTDPNKKKLCIIKQKTADEFETYLMSQDFYDKPNTASNDQNKWGYFSDDSDSPYPNPNQNRATLKNKTFNIPMPKNIHPCDENATEWEIGCTNNKIRAINKKLLDKDIDVLTDYLKKELIDDGYIDQTATKVPKFVYDQIMALHENQQDKFNVKKFKKLVNKKL